MTADFDDYVFGANTLPSDSVVASHREIIESCHALAAQQTVLRARCVPVVVPAAGGSIGYLYPGPIWALYTVTTGTIINGSPASGPILTHESGFNKTMQLWVPNDKVPNGTVSSTFWYTLANCLISNNIFAFATIDQPGLWSVSGLSADSLFFV